VRPQLLETELYSSKTFTSFPDVIVYGFTNELDVGITMLALNVKVFEPVDCTQILTRVPVDGLPEGTAIVRFAVVVTRYELSKLPAGVNVPPA
jgi:hypothetical protein